MSTPRRQLDCKQIQIYAWQRDEPQGMSSGLQNNTLLVAVPTTTKQQEEAMNGGHQDWTPQVVRKKGGGQAAAGGPMVAVQKCESLSRSCSRASIFALSSCRPLSPSPAPGRDQRPVC